MRYFSVYNCIFPSLLHQLLLQLRDPLALLPVTILRAIPVNLLALPAAVAVRLAPLAELAIGAVQPSAAYLAALPKIAQWLVNVIIVNDRCFQALLPSPRN